MSFRAKSRNLLPFQKHSEMSRLPLDVTKDGSHDAYSSWLHNCADRVSLLLSRTCRRLGLHRPDDAVRLRTDDHSADRARPEHSGRDDRLLSILAGRPFLLEIILAVRAAFSSRGVSRRLHPAIGFDPLNFFLAFPSFFCPPLCFFVN